MWGPFHPLDRGRVGGFAEEVTITFGQLHYREAFKIMWAGPAQCFKKKLFRYFKNRWPRAKGLGGSMKPNLKSRHFFQHWAWELFFNGGGLWFSFQRVGPLV